MTDSIRKSITSTLLTALQGVAVVNGFRTTVPEKHVLVGSGIPGEFPAFVILWGAERAEPSSHDLRTFRLGVVIECWVDEQEGTPLDALEDLLADARQAIENANDLYARIVQLEDLGASAPIVTDSDPNRAQCALNLEMVYRHQRSNPSLP